MSYIDEQQFKVRGDDLVKACTEVDALRLALAAAGDEAEKAKADTARLDVILSREYWPLPNDNRGMVGRPYITYASYSFADGAFQRGGEIHTREELDNAIKQAQADAARRPNVGLAFLPSLKASLSGTGNNDKNIRETAALIADYITPEGHDPEEWGQLCELAEKILRSLGLWLIAPAPAGGKPE